MHSFPDLVAIRLKREPRRLAAHSRSFPSRTALARVAAGVLWATAALGGGLSAAEDPDFRFDLDDLSLEQLVGIEITSVSRKETPLFRSPAAIGVVTSEDMRRMGATSFPEAMRWVPGVQIAQIDHNIWSVGARGFGYQYTDKLLVLQDGRSIYTPLFGGVHWDAHDAVLEDIERIEVIRGPGATLWGANAVNGVINIISKSARDTQGGLLSVAGGPGEGSEVSLRYGGQIAPDLYYRTFVKYVDRDPLRDASGAELPEDWSSWRGGFRLDWTPTASDEITLQGEVMTATVDEMYREPSFTPPLYFTLSPIDSDNHAFNVLGRWTRILANDSELSVQSYVDSGTHESFGTREERDTFDLDLQHRIVFGERHDVIWGAGYRVSRDDVAPSSNATWTPRRKTLQLATAFVQDEIAVVPERLHVVLGTKVEHNDFTGIEVQPGARLLWMPHEHQTVWAAVARAVRTPTRQNDGLEAVLGVMEIPGMGLSASYLSGNPDLQAEVLNAYELGYRAEVAGWLSLDVAVFHNDYRDYITFIPGEPEFVLTPVPHLRMLMETVNGAPFSAQGGELSIQALVTPSLRLVADHTQQYSRLPDQGFGEVGFGSRQSSLRAFWRVVPAVEVMAAAGYVSDIPSPYPGFPGIPSYVRCDLGVTWRPTPELELGLWGRNLQESQHLETYGITTPQPAEVPRSVLGRVTWRF